MKTLLELWQLDSEYLNVQYTLELLWKAAVALHSYIMNEKSFGSVARYCPIGFADTEGPGGAQLRGEWRDIVKRDQGLLHLGRVGSNNYSRSAKIVREDFSN